jgi:hypothetical protein
MSSGWLKAMKNGFFMTWPRLDAEHIILKHLPKLEATIKGHLQQPYKNIHSTSLTHKNSMLNATTL